MNIPVWSTGLLHINKFAYCKSTMPFVSLHQDNLPKFSFINLRNACRNHIINLIGFWANFQFFFHSWNSIAIFRNKYCSLIRPFLLIWNNFFIFLFLMFDLQIQPKNWNKEKEKSVSQCVLNQFFLTQHNT